MALIDRIIATSLLFLFALVPLIINPFALDYWYKPKIDSIYALLIIAGILWIVKTVTVRKPLMIRKNPLFFPLLAYGLISLFSTVQSVDLKLSMYGDTFREEGIFTIIAYIALVFIFAHAVESQHQIKKLLHGLLIASTIISLYAIIQFLGFNPTEHFIPLMRGIENRPGSTIGNPNFLGKFLVLILPLTIVSYCNATNTRIKYLFLTGCIILFSALFLTFTRASWFSFGCSFIVLAILLSKKIAWRKQRELIFIAALFIIFAVLWESQSLAQKIIRGDNNTPTAVGKIGRIFNPNKGDVVARLYLWKMALTLITQRPILGYGPDTHTRVMEKFNLEYARTFHYSGIIDRAHNNYLDIAIGQGLLGLAAYLLIIITFLFWLIKTMTAERNLNQKILYCGIIAALCGYFINDFFIFSVVSVSPTFWSLMGLTIAMQRLSSMQGIKSQGKHSANLLCNKQ